MQTGVLTSAASPAPELPAARVMQTMMAIARALQSMAEQALLMCCQFSGRINAYHILTRLPKLHIQVEGSTSVLLFCKSRLSRHGSTGCDSGTA